MITLIINVSEDFNILPSGITKEDSPNSLEIFLKTYKDSLFKYPNIIIDFLDVLHIGSNFLKFLCEYLLINNLNYKTTILVKEDYQQRLLKYYKV